MALHLQLKKYSLLSEYLHKLLSLGSVQSVLLGCLAGVAPIHSSRVVSGHGGFKMCELVGSDTALEIDGWTKIRLFGKRHNKKKENREKPTTNEKA